jgi:hypothetical protein
MTEIQNSKTVYDLEERTFQFSKAVRLFVKTLPKTMANIEKNFLINPGKIKITKPCFPLFWLLDIEI